MRPALLALVLVGCIPVSEPCPERYENKLLVEAAWQMTFPSDRGFCPCVTWKRQPELDCERRGPDIDDWREVPRGTGNGWIARDTSYGATCVYGLSGIEENRIWAITPEDLAHEMVHHWLARHTGDGDGTHTDRRWPSATRAARAAVAFYKVEAP